MFYILHILKKESIIKQKLAMTNKCAKQGVLLHMFMRLRFLPSLVY